MQLLFSIQAAQQSKLISTKLFLWGLGTERASGWPMQGGVGAKMHLRHSLAGSLTGKQRLKRNLHGANGPINNCLPNDSTQVASPVWRLFTPLPLLSLRLELFPSAQSVSWGTRIQLTLTVCNILRQCQTLATSSFVPNDIIFKCGLLNVWQMIVCTAQVGGKTSVERKWASNRFRRD